jgi:hypothetical protein
MIQIRNTFLTFFIITMNVLAHAQEVTQGVPNTLTYTIVDYAMVDVSRGVIVSDSGAKLDISCYKDAKSLTAGNGDEFNFDSLKKCKEAQKVFQKTTGMGGQIKVLLVVDNKAKKVTIVKGLTDSNDTKVSDKSEKSVTQPNTNSKDPAAEKKVNTAP